MRVTTLVLNVGLSLVAAAVAVGLTSSRPCAAQAPTDASDALRDGMVEVPFEELTYFTVPPERSCRFGDEPVVLTTRISLADRERGSYLLELTTQEIGDPAVDECVVQIGAGCIVHRELPPRHLSARELSLVAATVAGVFAELPEGTDPICPLWDPCMIEQYTVDGDPLPVDPCAVPRLSFEQGDTLFSMLQTLRRGDLAVENGDTNGDGSRDLADAVYLLDWLFTGTEKPVPIDCLVDLDCAGVIVVEENGDVNGDGSRDLADAVYLVSWLFSGGPAPFPICSCRPLEDG